MEGRLRGEAPERAKYGVIDEQLQRVERQLKDGGAIMDVGERGRNKVAQLKTMLDGKAQQNRLLHRLNPPKVNKYLRKDYGKARSRFSSRPCKKHRKLAELSDVKGINLMLMFPSTGQGQQRFFECHKLRGFTWLIQWGFL